MSVKRVIDNKKIGANIRLARVKKMMSQSELAKLLGVTQTHMSNLHFYMVPPGPIRIQALQVLLKTAE